MKFEGSRSKGTRLIERIRFHSLGHCDLDLWPTDPKINRGLLLNKGYQPMKFEGSGSKGTHRAITLWSLKTLGQRVLALLSGNSFYSSGHCDLDLWPTDPKINRGLLLNKGYHPMKFEDSRSKGTRVIERKRSVTDGQGKNNMSPPEGGDIITDCTCSSYSK